MSRPRNVDGRARSRRALLAGAGAAAAGAATSSGVRSIANPFPAIFAGSAVVSVSDHGARGDGRTDDSAAIRQAMAAVLGSRVGQQVRHVLLFPPGVYRVTQPDALLWSPTKGRPDPVFGLHIVGHGPRVSEIFFDTDAAPSSDPRRNNLITAAVRVRRLQISDMSFRSHNDANNFGYFWSVDKLTELSQYPEYGAGQNQDIVFSRVQWRGTWQRVIGIDGDAESNNNSEWQFLQCSTDMAAEFTDAFLHCGISSPDAHGQQNQFLNFQFEGCHFALRRGVLLRYDRGGSINVVGGSWSMADPDVGPCTYFSMPKQNGEFTATRLYVQGVRFEPKAADHRIIDCAWENGTVTFVSCSDMASLQYPEAAHFTTHVYRSRIGDRLPVVRYQDCALAGNHEVVTNDVRPAGGKLIYEGCRLYHHDEATGDGFLRWSGAASPPYAFRDCWNLTDVAG